MIRTTDEAEPTRRPSRPREHGRTGRGTRARLAAVVATAVVALAAAACSASGAASGTHAAGAPTASGPVPANIAVYPGSFYTWLPSLAAKQGFFAKNGIDAHLVDVSGGGTVAFAALASGSADLAMGDLSLAGPLLEKGQGITAVSDAARGGWVLVAAKGVHVPATFPASVQALKGRNVGVASLGSSSYFYLQQLSDAAGLGPNGVTYQAVGLTPANVVAALQSDQLAAAMVSPDAAYYLTTVAHDQVVFDFQDAAAMRGAGRLLASLAGTPGGWMWATDSWLHAHPGVATRFQLAMDEADVWAHNPANLATAVADLDAQGNLPVFAKGSGADAYVSAMLPKLTSWVPANGAGAYLHFWVSAGLLHRSIPTSQWYSPTIPTGPAAVLAAVQRAGLSLGGAA